MSRKLRAESGMTLIEVLVAMLIMAFGILALVAAFTSGILAIERGAATSVAGALADKQMETYRQGTYASIPIGTQPAVQCYRDASTACVAASPPPACVSAATCPYWLQATISWSCPLGTLVVGPPVTCSTGTGAAARPVKLVSIDVRDTSSTGKLLVNESSTFDSSTG